MNDILEEFKNRELAFFTHLKERLESYNKYQQKHPAARRLYALWYDAYNKGVQAFNIFQQIAHELYNKHLERALILYNQSYWTRPQLIETGSLDGNIRIIVLQLLNHGLPSHYFSQWMSIYNKELIQSIAQLTRELPQTEDAKHDLDWIAAWIATFPYQELDKPQKESEGSILKEYGVPALTGLGGFLLGKVISKV